MNRRGFTLTELMVGTLVMGIVGLALTQMMINDSRFVSRIEAMTNARQSARAALNTMSVELRMVSTGGLLGAETDSIVVRAPYGFGVLCPKSGIYRYAAMVPGDSITYVSSIAEGIGWRSDTFGTYTQHDLISVVEAPSADWPICSGAGYNILPDGRVMRLLIASDTLSEGTIFYLHHTITYWFAASAVLPGQRALWREIAPNPAEELLAPFDDDARFQFYVTGSTTPLSTPPADLSTVVGLDLRLIGAAEFTPQGATEPPSFELRTRVNFLNAQ